MVISANAKAMDRWATVPLSLARALFCWPFIYCTDVRSSSLTKYGWKPSVAESEVENQGLRNDRCAKAQLKNVTRWKTRNAEQSLIQSLSLSLSICRDSGFLEQVGGSPVGAVLPTVRGRERSDFCDKATPCLVQSATIGDSYCGWCHFSTIAHFSPILQHNDLGSNISPGLASSWSKSACFSLVSLFFVLGVSSWSQKCGKKSLSLSTVTIPVTGIWTQLYILSKHAKLYI